MKYFPLDLDLWLRGEGSADSYLLREGNGRRMCCQGQRMLMLGVEAARLTGRKSVSAVDRGHVVTNLAIDSAAYNSNDCPISMSDERRIANINAALEEAGADYRFAMPTPEHPAMIPYEAD